MTLAFFTIEWYPINIIICLIVVAVIGVIIWLLLKPKAAVTPPPYIPGTTPTPPPSTPIPTGLMTGTNLCFKSNNKGTFWTEGPTAYRWKNDCTSDNKAYMQLYLASDEGKCSDVSKLPSHPLKDGEIYRMCHIGDGYTKCLFNAYDEDWKNGSTPECDTTITHYPQAKWLLYKDGKGGYIKNGDIIWLQSLQVNFGGSRDCLGNGASGSAVNMHEDFCWNGDEPYKGKLIITNA